MYKIKFQKKDSEPVYLPLKFNEFKKALAAGEKIADNSLMKYIIKDNVIEYENGDLLIIERISYLRKDIR